MWAIGGAERAHREGHDVHRAALHAALEEAVQHLAHLGRVAPVVGRAGVLLGLRADEGAVLDPGDVGGVGEGEVGVRAAWRRRGARRCPLRSGSGRGSRTPPPSRRTSGWRRAGSGLRSPRPSRGAWRGWSARWPWSGLAHSPHSISWRFEADEAHVGFLVEDLQRRGFLLAALEKITVQAERLARFDLYARTGS